MARYGITIYRTDVYGPDPGLDFSVNPIELVVLDFNCIRVTWRQSSGKYSMARLIRNQTNFAENVDDGEVVWSQESDDGSAIQLSNNRIFDGFRDGEVSLSPKSESNIPLVPGKPVFYRMFLFDKDSEQWIRSGDALTLVPAKHSIHNTLMHWIPRVYTSSDQNPIGIIDTESDIYRFLEGFSFTAEELLTYIDLLLPDLSQDRYTHVPRIRLERRGLGLIPEPTLPIKNQRTLIREARSLYSRKGTELGLEAYVEALTGFAPTVTLEPNILLDNQDSTFFQGTGHWLGNNASLSFVHSLHNSVGAHDTETFFTTETKAIDRAYYGTATVSSTPASMTLGYDGSIVEDKIPVTPGKFYTFSAYIKTPSTKTITPTVKVYNQFGQALATYVGSATTNTSWTKITVSNVYAPKDVTQAINFAYSDATTIYYYTPVAAEVTAGSTVNVTGFTTTAFNVSNATVASVFEGGFTVSATVTETFESPSSAIVNTVYQGLDGVYAGISLAFSATGTYNIDLVCLQEGTTSTYSEARAINILLDPPKINYIKNPSFETAVTGGTFTSWTQTGATITRTSVIPPKLSSGQYSALIEGTNWSFNSNQIETIKGQYWTGSIYMKSTVATKLSLIRRDEFEDILHTKEVDIPASSTWKRVSVTDLVDCECISATIELAISGAGGQTYVDSAQLEPTYRMTEYQDGSQPFEMGGSWEGTAHNSYTVVYPGKPTKLVRLVATIDDWIPKNLWWRISTKTGLESKTFIE